MAKSTKKKTNNLLTMPTPASTVQSTAATDVASRAFELYCARGCQGGHDVEDWLQAERELHGTATLGEFAERNDATA
jgi:DUF2934 family protein